MSRAWIIRLEKGEPGIRLGMTLAAMRALGLEASVRFTLPEELAGRRPDPELAALDRPIVPGGGFAGEGERWIGRELS
jgi:hypothetical protein